MAVAGQSARAFNSAWPGCSWPMFSEVPANFPHAHFGFRTTHRNKNIQNRLARQKSRRTGASPRHPDPRTARGQKSCRHETLRMFLDFCWPAFSDADKAKSNKLPQRNSAAPDKMGHCDLFQDYDLGEQTVLHAVRRRRAEAESRAGSSAGSPGGSRGSSRAASPTLHRQLQTRGLNDVFDFRTELDGAGTVVCGRVRRYPPQEGARHFWLCYRPCEKVSRTLSILQGTVDSAYRGHCLLWTTLSTVDRGHHFMAPRCTFSPYHGQSIKKFFFVLFEKTG